MPDSDNGKLKQPNRLEQNLEVLRDTKTVIQSLQAKVAELEGAIGQKEAEKRIMLLKSEAIELNEALSDAVKKIQKVFFEFLPFNRPIVLSEETFQTAVYNPMIEICVDSNFDPVQWVGWTSQVHNGFNQMLEAIDKLESLLDNPSSLEEDDPLKSPESKTTIEQLNDFRTLVGDLQKLVYAFAICQGASADEIATETDAITSGEHLKKFHQPSLDKALRIIDGLVGPSSTNPEVRVPGYQKFITETIVSAQPSQNEILELVPKIDKLFQSIMSSSSALFAARALLHNLQTSHFAIQNYSKHLIHPDSPKSDDYAGRIAAFLHETQKAVNSLERFLVERSATVNEMCDFVTPNLLKKYGSSAEIIIDTGCQLYEIVHAQQIERIIEILLENAIQELSNSAIVDPKIEIKVAGIDESTITLSITDNGRGIHRAVVPYIFTETAISTKGTSGQGLHFAREAILKLKGDLALSQTGPAGTTFCLTLPRDRRSKD